jgi:hypothetical protein
MGGPNQVMQLQQAQLQQQQRQQQQQSPNLSTQINIVIQQRLQNQPAPLSGSWQSQFSISERVGLIFSM